MIKILQEKNFMSRIKEFRFTMSDAWGITDRGYESTLEISDSESVSILFLVNSRPYKIVLANVEEHFINDMCFLREWNNKKFDNYSVLDGYMWSLLYAYDNIHIKANGSNGFPGDFLKFLNLIHNKYDIPKADYEDEDFIASAIKNTKVSTLKDLM